MTEKTYDADDLLMAGGIPGAKFETIGTKVGGKILEKPVARQQTDFDTNEPLEYEDGEPRMQIVVQVQTDIVDPEIEDDDGVRCFYLKNQMKAAVRDAVRKAKAKRLEVGGDLTIELVDQVPNSRGRGNKKKVYAAVYVPPAGPDLLGVDQADEPKPEPAKKQGKKAGGKKAAERPEFVPVEAWEAMPVAQREAVAAAARAGGVGDKPPY